MARRPNHEEEPPKELPAEEETLKIVEPAKPPSMARMFEIEDAGPPPVLDDPAPAPPVASEGAPDLSHLSPSARERIEAQMEEGRRQLAKRAWNRPIKPPES